MFWKKKRLLRKAIQGQVEIMREVREHCEKEKQACDTIEQQWEEVTKVLQQIAPREPLTRKEIVVRIGISAGTFLGISILAVWLLSDVFFPVSSMTNTSIEGDTLSYRYIPLVTAKVSQFPGVYERASSEWVDVRRSDSLDGETVGFVFPDDATVELLHVRSEDRVGTMFRQRFTTLLQPIGEEEVVLLSGDVLDATVIRERERYLVAYARRTGGQAELLIQPFDFDWKAMAESVIIALTDNEDLDGLTLIQNGEGYLLLTRKDRASDATVLEKAVPYARRLDATFAVVQERPLATRDFTVDNHAALSVDANGQLIVVANGRDPLEASEVKKGDELFLFVYDVAWDLLSVTKLTHNGMPHDFHPSQLVEDSEHGLLYIPYQKVETLPQIDGEDNGYPVEAGKLFLMALKDRSEVVGTFFLADHPYRSDNTEPLRGARNVHMARAGERLFVAYDMIVQEDATDGGDGEYRVVRSKYISLDNDAY
jgi:hypothetical protein